MIKRSKYGTRTNHTGSIGPYVAVVVVSVAIVVAWYLLGTGIL